MKRLLLRPEEVQEALGIGRSKFYELIAKGELPSVRIGRLVRVPVAGIEQWVQRQTLNSRDVPDEEQHGSI